MSRFEARADVEALIDHFVNDGHSADTESHTLRPRHLSVNSVMERGFSQPQEVDGNPSNIEWQTDLKRRLENIEHTLLALSKRGESPTDAH
jgi:hypothetical protein